MVFRPSSQAFNLHGWTHQQIPWRVRSARPINGWNTAILCYRKCCPLSLHSHQAFGLKICNQAGHSLQHNCRLALMPHQLTLLRASLLCLRGSRSTLHQPLMEHQPDLACAVARVDIMSTIWVYPTTWFINILFPSSPSLFHSMCTYCFHEW